MPLFFLNNVITVKPNLDLYCLDVSCKCIGKSLFHTASGKFGNTTIIVSGFVFAENSVWEITLLSSYVIVFENVLFQSAFRPNENVKPVFPSARAGLKRVFEKLRFGDVSV